MRQGHRLDQIFMQMQRSGHGAGQLGHLQGMGQTRAKQIAFVVQKDLCFVDQSSEGA